MDLANGLEVADPIRVFVKQEPLKRSKYDERRWRIISAVSLEDTMVDRILFTRFQKKFLAAATTIPSMVGLNPLFGGYRLFSAVFGKGPYVCEDKSSWDWTVTEPLIRAALRLILRLADGAEHFWVSAVIKRWEMLFRKATFKFHPTSEECHQPSWGIVKSGCYLTIVLNTLLQLILHAFVNEDLDLSIDESMPFALGDDTLRKKHPKERDYVRRIGDLGVKLKTDIRTVAEFAGFEFDQHSVRPVYNAKHAFKLVTCPDHNLSEILGMYQILYAFDAEFYDWIHAVGYARGCEQALRSRRLALAIARGSISPQVWSTRF
nr:MAG: putative RNA polymerase [Eriocheir sinensis sobemo-like virus 1]